MKEKVDEISWVETYLKIREVLLFLWSKKIIIVITGFIGSIIGFSYALMTPTEYEGKLTFVVEQNGSGNSLGALSGLASSFGLGGITRDGGLYDNHSNLMNYLKSRTILEKAFLTDIPTTNTTFAEKFAQEYGWRQVWSEDSTL